MLARRCLLAACLLAVAPLAACETRTPGYCCDVAADCPDGVVRCPDEQTCNLGIHTCSGDVDGTCDSLTDGCTAATPFCVEVPGEELTTCSAACDDEQFSCATAAEAFGTDATLCVDGRCGACDPNANTCRAASPVCDQDDLTCRGCESDLECLDSFVCLDSGECAAEPDVIYVVATGGSGEACTLGAPCLLDGVPSALLATDRTLVKLLGEGETFTLPTQALTLTEPVTIFGDGATITRTTTGPVVNVTAAPTDSISLRGMVITGGHGGSTAHGVNCTSGNLSIHGATVGVAMEGGDTNSGAGVFTLGDCPLTIAASTIRGNQGPGIDASASVDISASTIAGNQGGGISVSNGGATSRITNNFIYGNGEEDPGGTTFGGVSFGGALGSVIAFNTIAFNDAQDGIGAGLDCTASGLIAISNLIVNNSSGANVQVDGNCGHDSSIFGPQQNIDGDWTNIGIGLPTFVDVGDGNLHLADGSAGIDDGAAVANVTTDFDGDPRPTGPMPDIGADEYVQ
jgi:hypothetical protein